MQAISQSDAVKVSDLIRASPASNPYQHLKDWLLRMYALTDFARFEAISSLPLSRDMLPSALMSKMLVLFPADHQACFFLCGAFLQCLPSDVKAHLVYDPILEPLSLALNADKIYWSCFSSSSALHHVSGTSDECPNLAVYAPSAICPCSQGFPTPGPCHRRSQPSAVTSWC